MKNNQQNLPKTQREMVQSQYNTARMNLLLMIGLTVVNIVLLFTGSETMMLFSATIPYYATMLGVYGEYYEFLYIGIAVAVISLGLYLLCWYLSKKNPVWMTVALVMFIIDTVALVALYIWAGDSSGIIDLAIHVWVAYYLVIGVKSARKLKTLPENEADTTEGLDFSVPEQEEEITHSTPIRRADTEVKFRVFVEGECAGHHVQFRRVKRTNELVIDNYVYGEIEMLIETPHELEAIIDSQKITAGYNGSFSYIKLNGEQVAKKLRLV